MTNLLPPAEPEEIRDFLTKLGGPWHLAHSKLWAGRTFTDLEQAVYAASDANNRGNCVYYMGNVVKGGHLTGTSRKKSDIESVVAVWIDIDETDTSVRDELLTRLDYPPAYVAFTGGGWQAMWRLSKATTPEDGESITCWIHSEFEDLSPDPTQSCEHLFRVPGTRNRKEKRHNRLCEIAGGVWESYFPTELMGRCEPRAPRQAVDVTISEWRGPTDILYLCGALPPSAFRMLDSNIDAKGKLFASRNEHEFAFVGACLRAGVNKDLIAHCMLTPASIEQTQLVSHRSYWAKLKGRFILRRNPMTHILREIGSHPELGGQND